MTKLKPEMAMNQNSKLNHGFTLIEVMIVVLLIGLLAAMAIPNFIRSRTTTQTNVCINNLRAIDYAIQQWALEEKKATASPVQFSDISSYLKRSVICPSGGSSFGDSYSVTIVGAEPVCQRVPAAHLLAEIGLAAAGNSSSSSGGPPTAPDPGAGLGDGASGAGTGSPNGNNGHNPPGRGQGNNNGQGNGP